MLCVDEIASVYTIEHTRISNRFRVNEWENEKERERERTRLYFSKIDLKLRFTMSNVSHLDGRSILIRLIFLARRVSLLLCVLLVCATASVCIWKLDNLDWASTTVCIYLLLAFFPRLVLSIWKSGICDAIWYVFIYKHYVAAIVWFDAFGVCVVVWVCVCAYVHDMKLRVPREWIRVYSCVCAIGYLFDVCLSVVSTFYYVFLTRLCDFLSHFTWKYISKRLGILVVSAAAAAAIAAVVVVHLHKNQITIMWTYNSIHLWAGRELICHHFHSVCQHSFGYFVNDIDWFGGCKCGCVSKLIHRNSKHFPAIWMHRTTTAICEWHNQTWKETQCLQHGIDFNRWNIKNVRVVISVLAWTLITKHELDENCSRYTKSMQIHKEKVSKIRR